MQEGVLQKWIDWRGAVRRLLAVLIFFPVLAWAQTGPIVSAPTGGTGDSFGSTCRSVTRSLLGGDTTTELTYSITPDQKIVDVTLLSSSGTPKLDETALNCVAAWRLDGTGNDGASSVGPHRAAMIWMKEDGAFGDLSGEFRPVASNCVGYYPPRAVRVGAEGTTILQFRVTTGGYVLSAQVTQSSGYADLDNAALACIKFFHYHPAMKDGKPVEIITKAAIKWALEH
jgi:TonB family protein